MSTPILLAIILAQAARAQGDGLPIILISSKPITSVDRKLLEASVDEAKANAKKHSQCLYIGLKEAHVFQVGDPLGLRRQEWARLTFGEIQAMRAMGREWFKAADLSPSVRQGFLEWATERFSQYPGLAAFDFNEANFKTDGIAQVTLNTPNGNSILPKGKAPTPPPLEKVITITPEMKKKPAKAGKAGFSEIHIERSEYRRSVAAKGVAAYFEWLQLQLGESKAKFDLAREDFFTKQLNISLLKVGQEIGDISKEDRALWRVHARQMIFEKTGQGATLDEGAQLASSFKVGEVRLGLFVQIYVREGEDRPRLVSIEFGL